MSQKYYGSSPLAPAELRWELRVVRDRYFSELKKDGDSAVTREYKERLTELNDLGALPASDKP